MKKNEILRLETVSEVNEFCLGVILKENFSMPLISYK